MSDPSYYNSNKLIRPYRVGISCGSCHIALPTNPPADPENPDGRTSRLSLAINTSGKGKRLPLVGKGGFFWEMLQAQPPGTSDTSRIATDHLNNPNTINPIFELGARRMASEEQLAGETLKMPHAACFESAACSEGRRGLDRHRWRHLRVYVNIGMYAQYWLQQHNALIGLSRNRNRSSIGKPPRRTRSIGWRPSRRIRGDAAKFFMRLKFLPTRGRAWRQRLPYERRGGVESRQACLCRELRSMPLEQAPAAAGTDQDEWFRQEVMKADFRDNNFFSDDKRYAITKLKSNAARACATNAKRGHVWENFSSETYKNLPSPGDIDVVESVHGADGEIYRPEWRIGLLSHSLADQHLVLGAVPAQ